MILKWFLIAATILNVVAYVVPTRAEDAPPAPIKICTTFKDIVDANDPKSEVVQLTGEQWIAMQRVLKELTVDDPPKGAKTAVIGRVPPFDMDAGYRLSVHDENGCMLGSLHVGSQVVIQALGSDS